MNLFNPESEFNQFMAKAFDMVLLNLMFIVGCLPIITIGASCTALHTVTLKMAEGDEPYILKEFVAAFLKNFKTATITWVLLLLTAGFLYVDQGLAINGGSAGTLMTFLVIILEVLYLFVFIYVFPLIARYDNTVNQHLKNAMLIAIRQFPTTLLLAGTIIAWMLIGMYAPTAFVLAWIIATPIIFFSLRAYLQDKKLAKIFAKYDAMIEAEALAEAKAIAEAEK